MAYVIRITDITGKTVEYTYDNDELNRLKTVLYPELGLETYTYDNAGNRKSKVVGSKTTTYDCDSNNRLTQSTENGIITIYSYDNNGNLTEESVNGAKTLYTYDGFDKLIETVKPDGKWLHNEYSAEGLRVSTEENGFRYDFVFDRDNIITELNANTQQYTRSIRGVGLVGQEDSKNNLSYYLSNAHGDVVGLVASDGQVLNSYQYDAFGNTTSYAEKVANRFMYAGEQFDRTTGQYYLRARYYNPVVGRFTQEDTYRGDGLNVYAYVANNPINFIDPTGFCKDSANGGLDMPIASGTEAGYENDTGLDIAAPVGTDVYAIASGTIVYSEYGHTKWRPSKDHPDDTPNSILIKLDNPITYNGRTAYYA